jgi:hypothetical protein
MRSAKCIHKEMQVHVEGRAVKPNDHSLVAGLRRTVSKVMRPRGIRALEQPGGR